MPARQRAGNVEGLRNGTAQPRFNLAGLVSQTRVSDTVAEVRKRMPLAASNSRVRKLSQAGVPASAIETPAGWSAAARKHRQWIVK